MIVNSIQPQSRGALQVAPLFFKQQYRNQAGLGQDHVPTRPCAYCHWISSHDVKQRRQVFVQLTMRFYKVAFS